jgi:hypothetical protein
MLPPVALCPCANCRPQWTKLERIAHERGIPPFLLPIELRQLIAAAVKQKASS